MGRRECAFKTRSRKEWKNRKLMPPPPTTLSHLYRIPSMYANPSPMDLFSLVAFAFMAMKIPKESMSSAWT